MSAPPQYAPPAADGPPPRFASVPNPHAGPKAYRVIGVLSIVFASLMIAISISNFFVKDPTQAIVAEALAKLPPTVEWQKQLEPLWRRMYVSGMIENAVLLAMSGVLLVLGVGQWRFARWSWFPTIVWSALALACTAALCIVQLTVQAPAFAATMRYVQRAIPSGLPPQQKMSLQVTEWIMNAWWLAIPIYAPYPIVVFSIVGRRSIRERLWLHGQPARAEQGG
jgi:hypothetical protein